MMHIEKGKQNSDNCKVLSFMTIIFGIIWLWSKANEMVCFGEKKMSTMDHCIKAGEPAYDIVMMITLGIVILVAVMTIIEFMGIHISFGKKEEEIENI